MSKGQWGGLMPKERRRLLTTTNARDPANGIPWAAELMGVCFMDDGNIPTDPAMAPHILDAYDSVCVDHRRGGRVNVERTGVTIYATPAQ